MKKLFVGLSVGIALAMGACPAAALTSNEVRAKHIAEADNTSGQNTNSGKGIKTGHLQNDAVTAPKIGFYKRVVIVDVNGGGDFTSPVAALASITTASATNPYLVRIMPGVYNVGATPVQLKEYVDVEGSGEETTIITGAVDGGTTLPPTTGVVLGASHMELRGLTVENTFSTGVICTGIANIGASPSIHHVRVLASGTGATTRNVGIGNDAAAAKLEHVTVRAVGGRNNYGVYNDKGSPVVLRDVDIEAAGGTYNNGLRNYGGSDADVRGITILTSAVGVADPASEAVGILNTASSPRIREATVTAEGGTNCSYGIETSGSAPRLEDSVIEASAPGTGVGVYLRDDAAPIATNIIASGTTCGMQITGAATVRIDRSTISGDSCAIENADGNTLRIGASRLGGGLNLAVGTWSCAGAYNDSNVMLDATCSD